ncbi:MAG: single-stranded DNA-binding protein, partial [Thermosphaera sp.]
FSGKVQLNIGKTTEIKKIEDSEVPQAEEVPEEMPTAPEGSRPREFRRGGSFRGPRRGGFRRREE